MTQGDEVAGFFGGLDARDAGNAQHIALFGMSFYHLFQGGLQHVNLTARDGDAMSR